MKRRNCDKKAEYQVEVTVKVVLVTSSYTYATSSSYHYYQVEVTVKVVLEGLKYVCLHHFILLQKKKHVLKNTYLKYVRLH